MVEPITALTIGAGAYFVEKSGGKELLIKLLGPSFDYFGVELKNASTIGADNLARIVRKAYVKLGGDIEKQGGVPPKILKEILHEGYFCDDELTSEYFAGVLAHSRTKEGKDDRGVIYLKLISRISNYDLRLHYYVYSFLLKMFDGSRANMGRKTVRNKLQVFIPLEAYKKLMEFSKSDDAYAIVNHSMTNMNREKLILDYRKGSKEFLKYYFPDLDIEEEYGVVVTPSRFGVDLYIQAHGIKQITSHSFFYRGVAKKINIANLQMPSGIRMVKKDITFTDEELRRAGIIDEDTGNPVNNTRI